MQLLPQDSCMLRPWESTNCTRRGFVGGALGIGSLALAHLLEREARSSAEDVACPATSFEPRATSVIFLAMMGGTSQLDLFHHKPELRKRDARPLPASVTKGERFANVPAQSPVLASPFHFQRSGNAGIWHSSLLPHFASIADRVCLLRTMHTEEINHPAGQMRMLTGSNLSGRPSIGAWVSYGLGSLAEDLPTFVVLNSGEGTECGQECVGSGFLSAQHAGVALEAEKESLLHLGNPAGVSRESRWRSLKAMDHLNDLDYRRVGDRSILDRNFQYEMAFRLQASLPKLADFSDEPEHMLRMYGLEKSRSSYAANCLLARRLVERGVRFVQLNHGGWDFHSQLVPRIPEICKEVDQATAALVLDLAQRGLLDQTIVIWGSEFGRTPISQGRSGRDHHKTFCIWLAGGGFRAGFEFGQTDDFGFQPVSATIDFHDLHATLLRQLGLDHKRLTFTHQGREFRLTDVNGVVRHEILAS